MSPDSVFSALSSGHIGNLIHSTNTRVIYAPHRTCMTSLRRIPRESSKGLRLIVFLVIVCSLTQVSKGETMVSGKPVSHWVEKLEDRDRREWAKALDTLRLCNKEDLNSAKKRLREMAVGGSILSRKAALILFDKFQEVDAKFTDAYLMTESDETYVRGGTAIRALAGTSLEGSRAALAALLKKLRTVDGTEKWSSAVSELTLEVIAISKAKR